MEHFPFAMRQAAAEAPVDDSVDHSLLSDINVRVWKFLIGDASICFIAQVTASKACGRAASKNAGSFLGTRNGNCLVVLTDQVSLCSLSAVVPLRIRAQSRHSSL